MKKILFGIALLFMAGNLFAQDVEDLFTFRYYDGNQKDLLTLKKGEQTRIVISLDRYTTNQYIGTQFVIELPEGLTVALNNQGNPRISRPAKSTDVGMVSGYDDDDNPIYPFTVSSNMNSSNECTVMVFQLPPLQGENGEAIKFPVKSNDIVSVYLEATQDLRTDICPIHIKDAILSVSATEPYPVSYVGMIEYGIGDSGYGTLCVDNPIDFTKSDLSAFTLGTLGTNYAKLDEIEKVPASTPVVLKGTSGNYILRQLSGDAGTVGTNLLKGTPDAEITSDGNAFAIAKKEKGTAFYRVEKGVVIPQYKAYLENATAANDFILFEDATGINSVEKAAAETDVYTITGVKVNNTVQKGVYIQNGKKVVVK